MLKISAPGRICLFGEHQDYLQLPVITSAINLRISITAEPINQQKFIINMPDIDDEDVLDISKNIELSYIKERDYFRSIYNVLFRKGVRWHQGYRCTVTGKIPINSGTSSSSALNNVWSRFLLEVGEHVDPKWKSNIEVGNLSYLAEVIEFNEPGGKMDQLATAIGRTLYIDFSNNGKVTELPLNLGTFVLGDSKEPKDTMKILAKIKAPALEAEKIISSLYPDFCFKTFSLKLLKDFRNHLSDRQYKVMQGMLKNRDICCAAFELLSKKTLDETGFGSLLNEHHYYLDHNLGISTPKINRMLDAALEAGALGGKINGSGGGGCMFAYAPENPEAVVKAIESVGGKSYMVNISNGLELSFL